MPALVALAFASDGAALDPTAARRVASAHFEHGGLTVDVGPAVVVPVLQKGATIGVGFVADGTLSLDLADAADAIRFANRQVPLGDRSIDEMRPVAHREAPFTTTVLAGFVFGSDVVVSPWLDGEPADGDGAARALADRLEVIDAAVSLSTGQKKGAAPD